MTPMVELKNITIRYHSTSGETKAVSDLSFSIEQGEFVCIVGPSGCGKSSILSMLAGLIKPSSGTFKIHSQTNIGYMLQKDYLLEWRNIFSNACLGLEIQNKLTPENIQRLYVSDEIGTIIRKEKKTAILVSHDISEAISLSDRVFVLSHRPASLKSVHKIDLSIEDRTPMKAREAPEFKDYFNKIWKELDVHVA